MKGTLIVVGTILFTLCGCTTYELRGDNLNTATALPATDALTIREKSLQPWYPATDLNLSYVSFVSRINTTNTDVNVFADLGCSRGPISLSSSQQDFILTGNLGTANAKSYPLFSFSRNDASRICSINTQSVTLGPLKIATQNYNINVEVKSTQADKVTVSSLFSAVAPVMTAFNISGAYIWGAGQEAANNALQGFEKYLNQNMQLVLGSTSTLATIPIQDIRSGNLVYGSNLSIHKLDNGSEANPPIPVGRLEIVVKTQMSLFTDKTVSISNADWAQYNAAWKTKFNFPFLPSYELLDTWQQNVIPIGQTDAVQLAVGIDMNEPNPVNHVLPDLNLLGETATEVAITNFCSKLKSRLVTLQFNLPDRLAILSHAITHAPGYKSGANFTKEKLNCFSDNELLLMQLMNISTGRPSPKPTT